MSESAPQTLVLENTVDQSQAVPPLMGAAPAEHPLIGLPFAVEIDGRSYRGEGISLTRADIAGLIDPHLEGETRLVAVMFPFDGFNILLSVECVISQSGSGRATLFFRDPAGEHLPQLRHLLNSYVAGDVVALGPVLAVSTASAAPGNKTKKAQAGTPLWRRLAGGAAVLALTAVLAVAVGRLAYARLYAVQVPVAAQVVTEGQTLRALAAGQIDYVNASANAGEVAFTLATVAGSSVSVAMPCDCAGQLLAKGVGDTVLAGDPVMSLSEPDAPAVLRVSLEGGYLFEMAAADHVNARFPDGETVRLAVDPTQLATPVAGEQAVVTLRADPPLAPERLGQLAQLTIVRQTPGLIQPIVQFVENIGF